MKSYKKLVIFIALLGSYNYVCTSEIELNFFEIDKLSTEIFLSSKSGAINLDTLANLDKSITDCFNFLKNKPKEDNEYYRTVENLFNNLLKIKSELHKKIKTK